MYIKVNNFENGFSFSFEFGHNHCLVNSKMTKIYIIHVITYKNILHIVRRDEQLIIHYSQGFTHLFTKEVFFVTSSPDDEAIMGSALNGKIIYS